MAEVVVYRRPGCMFCEQVEEILVENGVPFESVEVKERHEQEAISRRHGALAFPLVLVGGNYIGGFTHVVQLHSEGRLRAVMLGEKPKDAGKPDSGMGLGSLSGYAALGRLLNQRKTGE